MANFKVKNGLQAGRYLLNSTTLSGSTIDLSLANMFSTTLSSDPAYAFTNPPPSGTAQAFSVEVTGGTTNFTNDAFATTLYTGNSGTQTITNGIDLAGDGGLVIVRGRNVASNTFVFDTERGASKYIMTASTNAEGTQSTGVNSFNSSGFVTGSYAGTNSTGTNYVSWAFKKQAKFFDIVTYTGNSTAGRTVSHNLGATPGMIIVKVTNASDDWRVYHRGVDPTAPEDYVLYLNATTAKTNVPRWNDTPPTSTEFTLGADTSVNGSGLTYVAYLFAHDTASDSRIQCGGFTTDSVDHATITLGWKPQWLLVKRSDNSAAGDWRIIDSVRGVTDTGDAAYLEANTTDVEAQTGNGIYTFTNTGFTQDNLGANRQYIYTAIRASTATDSAITWPSSVKWPSGLAPTTPAAGTKDLFTFLTTDGGTTYYGKKAAGGIA